MIYEQLQYFLATPKDSIDNNFIRSKFDFRLDELIDYQPVGRENDVCRRMADYLSKKYGVNIYKCAIFYRETQKVYRIEGFPFTREESSKILAQTHMALSDGGAERYKEDKDTAKQILLDCEFTADEIDGKEPAVTCFSSCEELAVKQCYADAHWDCLNINKRMFNPDTMDEKKSRGLFYVYKNQQFLEESELRGEQDRIKEEVYKVLKKHDKYNAISWNDHFGVLFLNSEVYFPHWQTDSDLLSSIQFPKK